MCEYCNKKVRNKKIQDIDNDEEDGMFIVFLDEPYLNVELDANKPKIIEEIEINSFSI